MKYKEYKYCFSKQNNFILNEKNFYDPNKTYSRKTFFLTKNEKILYEIIVTKLPPKYIVLPQVNLQTIIDVTLPNGNKERNNELFRNVDFCIFEKFLNRDKKEIDYEDFKPVLVIEINGEEHYKKETKMKRDFSVKQILTKAHIPFIFLKNQDLENTVVKVFEKIKNKLSIKK